MVFHSFFVSILYRMGRFGYFAICKVVERFQYGTIWFNMIQLFASIIGVINIVFNIKMNVKWQQAKLELRKSANTDDKNFMP